MKKIISFWENQSKTGNTYYSGKLGELDLIGFKNSQKKNEKEPDLIFYLRDEKPKKEETTIYTKDIDVNDMFDEVEITDNLLD
jgi:hypothetical protein